MSLLRRPIVAEAANQTVNLGKSCSMYTVQMAISLAQTPPEVRDTYVTPLQPEHL